jgi:hypothetical protein
MSSREIDSVHGSGHTDMGIIIVVYQAHPDLLQSIFAGPGQHHASKQASTQKVYYDLLVSDKLGLEAGLRPLNPPSRIMSRNDRSEINFLLR